MMNEAVFRFAFPEHLYALLGVGIFIVVWIVLYFVERKRLSAFADKDKLTVLIPDYSPFRKFLKFSLLVLAAIFIIVAWARPQYGVKKQNVKKKGVEIAIALDVSNSMLAEDIKPNRIEKAKFSIQRIINKLDQNKVSIITFAGEAYIQLPMTTDVGASKLFLQNISTNMMDKQGTAIGAAISKCMRSFSGDEKTAKTIIVISDGENHEDDAVAMAKEAREKGIVIHTVGMGTTSGVPIPIRNQYGQTNFLMDRNGSPVTTKLNEQMLQEIAAAGGGIYSREEFSPILRALDEMEKSDFESKDFSVYNERFQIFLILGLICLFVDFFVFERKNHWLKDINVFNLKIGAKK
ncbi:MAG: VWA domain-containing protein [Bacteroidales bacterium]|nr:VWA domain-containing protein [Bacteroidales bacterium]